MEFLCFPFICMQTTTLAMSTPSTGITSNTITGEIMSTSITSTTWPPITTHTVQLNVTTASINYSTPINGISLSSSPNLVETSVSTGLLHVTSLSTMYSTSSPSATSTAATYKTQVLFTSMDTYRSTEFSTKLMPMPSSISVTSTNGIWTSIYSSSRLSSVSTSTKGSLSTKTSTSQTIVPFSGKTIIHLSHQSTSFWWFLGINITLKYQYNIESAVLLRKSVITNRTILDNVQNMVGQCCKKKKNRHTWRCSVMKFSSGQCILQFDQCSNWSCKNRNSIDRKVS
jgi:hypothetical protein